MGKCPECKAPVDVKSKICPKCGCDLITAAGVAPASDTLNVADHFATEMQASDQADPDATIDSTPTSLPPAAAAAAGTAAAEAIGAAAKGSNKDADDTLDPSLGLTPDPRDIEATQKEMADEVEKAGTAVTSVLRLEDIPQAEADIAATIDSQVPGDGGDEIKTIVVAADASGSGKDTAMYSESDLREALQGRPTTGTSGALKNVWQIGSSGSDNPSHTLRGDDAQALASDSLFKRVAMRRVAQANAPADIQADYMIVNKLGQGGMGVVYSARQTNVDRIVALKAIKSELQASDDNRRKFFYEAQITADLDHPNIVPIYELGATEDGLLFYSMKQITGTEWKDVIKTKSREENLEILSKINDAMAFAHSKGIVHRDLKPANTMLGPYGEVYVTDWGMAIDTRKKNTFGPGGSPSYMAPEMALHKIKEIGKASDIYILGAILYQIIAGHPPHPGRTVQECLRAAARNDIIPHKTDDALMPIALRALATKPADRYKSVEDFQEALREYRQHAESIALAQRSEEMLTKAKESKDYDMFSRAVFGYRDAVELWPENEMASGGLKRAQLEYGQCAVAKGDYDLAMQTLDRSDREQAAVFALAVKGKEQVAGREKRLKTLRKAIAAVVLAGIGISTTFAVIAWVQRGQAIANAKVAEEQRDRAQQEEKKAKEQEAIATREKGIAEKATASAVRNEAAAMASAAAAMEAKNLAEESTKRAVAAKAAEEMQRMLAEANEKKAREEEAKAKEATKIAEQRAAQIQLGEYQATLALAKSQIETFDVKASTDNLTKLSALDSPAFKAMTPKTNTWPWQRIQLLSNENLPKLPIGSTPSSLDFSAASNISVAGTRKGEIKIISHADGKLTEFGSHTEPNAEIEAVAISPKADEVVYSFKSNGEYGFRAWQLVDGKPVGKPVKVEAAAKRSLQGLAYSSDGQYVVAGINNGVWLWNRADKWYEQKEASNQYKKTLGTLKSLSITGPNQAIVGSKRNNMDDLTLYAIDLSKADSSRAIKVPTGLQINVVNFDVAGQQLIMGSADGQLYTASLKSGADAIELADIKPILPLKHRTAVEQIAVAPNGQMLTLSAEPVVHVWARDAKNGWAYDTYLTGTPGNIARAAFVGTGKVMGVDVNGQSIAWDIQRQKQYRQLTRVPADDEPGTKAEYPDRVIGVFPRADGRVVSVDSASVIDVWNLQDGKTTRFDDKRFVIYGHTPGSEFVDSAVDTEAGVVVTAVRLTGVNPLYLENKDVRWEVCVWNQKNGELMHRWYPKMAEPAKGRSAISELQKMKGVIDLRLSLVNHGQALILASDDDTQLVSLDGQAIFKRDDFGTYFAVTHPQQPNLLMLVMRSGAVRLFDLNQPDSWQQSPREYGLNTVSDTPLQGVWSPEGQRFYLTFNSGAVAAFDWNGSKLSLGWSSHRLEGENSTLELQKALNEDSIRVKSHADVDMDVRVDGNKETLIIVRRARGGSGTTSLTVLDFDTIASPKLKDTKKFDEIRWLADSKSEPQLRLHNRLAVDNRQVFARRAVNGQTFITTNTANVYRLVDGSIDYTSYGRQKLVHATSDRAVNKILMLQDDGSVLKVTVPATGAPVVSKHGFNLVGAQRIELSPDGKLLAVSGGEGSTAYVKLVDAETGAEVQNVAGGLAATWQPDVDAQLLVCFGDGKLVRATADGVNPLPHQADLTDAKVVEIFSLTEQFNEANVPANKYVVIQSESSNSAYVQFVPMDANMAKMERAEIEAWKGQKVTVSPTEQVIVTGDSLGTVKLWFATPSWDNKPKELYELEGHRGANIELAKFTADGKTLISSDAKRRLLGWLSEDIWAKN